MLAFHSKRNISPQKRQFTTFLSVATVGILVIVALSIVLLCMAGWWFSYEEIMIWFHEQSRLYYEIAPNGRQLLFTYHQYEISRYISLALSGIFITTMILICRFWATIISWLATFYQSFCFLINQSFQTFTSLARWKILTFFFIMALALAYQLFHYHQFIIFLDDLWSYQYFAKNIIIASIFYPIPNNHVFYNQLSHLLTYLTDDPLLSTRLPSLISYVLLGLLLFGFQLRYFKDQKITFLGLILIMFLLPSSIYATQGRGYMLQNLCIVFSAIMMLLGVLYKKYEYLVGFIFVSVVGAYIVPTFLIPFLANIIFGIFVCLIQKNKKGSQIMVVSSLLVGIGVIFCYMPVFLFSGTASVLSNNYVLPIHQSDFFTRIYPIVTAELLSFFAGTNTKGWVIFLIFIAVAIPVFKNSSQKVQYWLLLTFIHIAIIFLYALFRKSFLPFRGVTYACFFLYISFSIVVVYWLNKMLAEKYINHVAFVGVCLLSFFISYRQYQHNVFLTNIYPTGYTRRLSGYTDEILKNNAKLYIDHHLNYFYLYFKYRTVQDEKLNFTLSNPEDANLLFLVNPLSDQSMLKKFHLKEKLIPNKTFFDAIYIFERNHE